VKPLRPEEEWARQVIEATLDVSVVQHDDNGGAAMYDLRILRLDRPAAVEVTAAADSASIELWRIINGGDERWQVDGLAGGWAVSLLPTARGKVVLRCLPSFLLELEVAGVPQLRGRPGASGLSGRAAELGVVSASQYGTDFPGSIYPTIELSHDRSYGVVAGDGDSLPQWIEEYLTRHPDVLDKLRRAGTQERHVFIIVPGFSTAPFGVTDLLMRHEPPMPTTPPRLPPEITHLWVVSTWTIGRGVRWAPQLGWSAFDKAAKRAA
jgi:hypothetical protein